MSWNSAPRRRIWRTSSTRLRTAALSARSDFMPGHHVGQPRVIEAVRSGVVGEGDLLLVAAGPQAGAALQHVTPPVPQGQRYDLAVGPRGGHPLAPPGGQLGQRLGQGFRDVLALEV